MCKYQRIGDYIELVDERNRDLKVQTLLGLSISKQFIPSVANTIGTNMRNYKIIRKGQFACSLMQVRRDGKIPIALQQEYPEAIISQAYPVFQIKDVNELLPQYLMMWMSRSEFDRHACFLAVGGVRGSLEWEDFCDMEFPVPSIEKQREIVKEYNTVVNRIKLNEQLNQKLEETAQALYKHWFVDYSTEDLDYLDDYIYFNPKHSIKKDSVISYIEMADVQESTMSIKKTIKREFTSGSKFINGDTLFARITPCLENGKTAFVDCLEGFEVAYGSTEFIVMRAKTGISPYWVYCLAKDDRFRAYAISSMVGSSGRQRVHSDYLKDYKVKTITSDKMDGFHLKMKPLFKQIYLRAKETHQLKGMKELLLSKMTKVEQE